MAYVVSSGSIKALALGTAAPPSNWYATSFDDGAWAAPQLVSPCSPAPHTAFAGASTVWPVTGTVGASDVALFRQWFTPDWMPTGDGVWFNVRANDYIELWLNGVRVLRDGNPWTGGGLDWVRVAPSYFVSGQNLLAVRVQNQAGTAEGDAGGCWELQVDATSGPTVYCALGSRVKTSILEDALYVTGRQLCAATGALTPLLSPICEALFPAYVDLESLCSSTPPDLPELDWLSIVVNGQLPHIKPILQSWIEIAWQRTNWNTYCECVPGPGVVNYPTPSAPTWPPELPAFTPDTFSGCTVEDLCKQVANLQAMIGPLVTQVNLIQRQAVPFAYLLGGAYSVSGTGSISVQGILGLSVNITAAPDWIGSYPGTPVTKVNYGFLNLGTPEGYQRGIPLRHDPQLILDISGAVTLVGYTFTQGVTATIQTLLREY